MHGFFFLLTSLPPLCCAAWRGLTIGNAPLFPHGNLFLLLNRTAPPSRRLAKMGFLFFFLGCFPPHLLVELGPLPFSLNSTSPPLLHGATFFFNEILAVLPPPPCVVLCYGQECFSDRKFANKRFFSSAQFSGMSSS